MNAEFKATSKEHRGSSIKVTAPTLSIELIQMVIWLMRHQEDASLLLPEYKKIRQQATARDEAPKTQTTHNAR